jgi:hypothetical protein
MKDYTDDMLTKLSLCSGCKKMYYLDGDTKTCDNCKARKVVNNAKAKQNAVPCSKDGCNNKRSVENEYCKLHQLQVFIDETKAAGKKLCYNHNRGCRTQLDESYGYSKCQPCLGDERKKDNEKRNKIKSDNEKVVAPELRTEKGCTNCCKILPMEQFKGILPPHTETLNCISCRENNTRHDLNRDKEHRNELARINDSKPERIEVKKQWKEDNYEKVAGYHMNTKQNKIERVGIDEYLKDNAEHAQNWRNNNPDKQMEFNETRRNSYESQYKVYERSAGLKNLEFSISFDEYKEIVKIPCNYCGIIQNRGTEEFNGVDRKNSAIGYVKDNCVSSCQMCNYMKNTVSVNVFINRVEHILSYNNHVNGSFFPELFGDHTPNFNAYKYRASERKIDFSITKDDFKNVTERECYICGKQNTITHSNGIDRRDNNVGYLLENCSSCCGQCNYMKRNYEYDDMFDKFKMIYSHNNSKSKGIESGIECQNMIENNPVVKCSESSIEEPPTELNENKSLSKGTNRKTKEEIKEEGRARQQKKRDELRKKLGDEEYKRWHSKKVAELRAKKQLDKTKITETEPAMTEAIREATTTPIIVNIPEKEKPLIGNIKTKEEINEGNRLRKQKQREEMRKKLGDEEYKKEHSKKIAECREKKQTKKESPVAV